jgi:hypothetical protein
MEGLNFSRRHVREQRGIDTFYLFMARMLFASCHMEQLQAEPVEIEKEKEKGISFNSGGERRRKHHCAECALKSRHLVKIQNSSRVRYLWRYQCMDMTI